MWGVPRYRMINSPRPRHNGNPIRRAEPRRAEPPVSLLYPVYHSDQSSIPAIVRPPYTSCLCLARAYPSVPRTRTRHSSLETRLIRLILLRRSWWGWYGITYPFPFNKGSHSIIILPYYAITTVRYQAKRWMIHRQCGFAHVHSSNSII